MTQSAALGTGLSAIAELPIPDDAKATLMANAPLADAITYGFGDLGLILFLTWLGPNHQRADLKREAKELEADSSPAASRREDTLGAHFGFRAYRVETPSVAARRSRHWKHRYADARLSVQRVQRGGALLTLDPALTLQPGDRIVVSASEQRVHQRRTRHRTGAR